MAPKKGAAGGKRKAEDPGSDGEEGGRKEKKASGGTSLVHADRIREINGGEVGSGPVIYWMSRDQRSRDNWALLHACEVAQKSGAPVAVAFNLVTEYLGAGARQFGFMLRGLKSLEPALQELNIPLFLLKGHPAETIPKLVKDSKASLLVVDQSPVRVARQWREEVGKKLGGVPFHEVDAHNVVPVWKASDKREYGARTIRTKIHKALPTYLHEFPSAGKQAAWKEPKPPKNDWDATIKEAVTRGKEVPEIDWAKPGQDEAWKALEAFVSSKDRIGIFAEERNDPNEPKALSSLSPYIHFGHLSMQAAALEAMQHKKQFRTGVDAFLEEAVVRRELSDNFCYYELDYDSLTCISDWAKDSLNKHRSDKREYTYSYEQFEKGETHDELWNAAQHEMVYGGKMHGFLRMYWAKKILEWTKDPDEALDFAIRLNDKWEIDGRDPNGYVGCIWSVGGIHDQGWSEREVFGKIRYMNYNGCKRKFDIGGYVERVNKLIESKTK